MSIFEGATSPPMGLRLSLVLNKAAREGSEPLMARVAVWELCPVTAKFLQLACRNLEEAA